MLENDEDSVDIDKVDDNGCEEFDLFKRFGVEVNGIKYWKDSILGNKNDLLIFFILFYLIKCNEVKIELRYL